MVEELRQLASRIDKLSFENQRLRRAATTAESTVGAKLEQQRQIYEALGVVEGRSGKYRQQTNMREMEKDLRTRVAALEEQARMKDDALRELRGTTRSLRIQDLEQRLREQVLQTTRLRELLQQNSASGWQLSHVGGEVDEKLQELAALEEENEMLERQQAQLHGSLLNNSGRAEQLLCEVKLARSEALRLKEAKTQVLRSTQAKAAQIIERAYAAYKMRFMISLRIRQRQLRVAFHAERRGYKKQVNISAPTPQSSPRMQRIFTDSDILPAIIKEAKAAENTILSAPSDLQDSQQQPGAAVRTERMPSLGVSGKRRYAPLLSFEEVRWSVYMPPPPLFVLEGKAHSYGASDDDDATCLLPSVVTLAAPSHDCTVSDGADALLMQPQQGANCDPPTAPDADVLLMQPQVEAVVSLEQRQPIVYDEVDGKASTPRELPPLQHKISTPRIVLDNQMTPRTPLPPIERLDTGTPPVAESTPFVPHIEEARVRLLELPASPTAGSVVHIAPAGDSYPDHSEFDDLLAQLGDDCDAVLDESLSVSPFITPRGDILPPTFVTEDPGVQRVGGGLSLPSSEPLPTETVASVLTDTQVDASVPTTIPVTAVCDAVIGQMEAATLETVGDALLHEDAAVGSTEIQPACTTQTDVDAPSVVVEQTVTSESVSDVGIENLPLNVDGSVPLTADERADNAGRLKDDGNDICTKDGGEQSECRSPDDQCLTTQLELDCTNGAAMVDVPLADMSDRIVDGDALSQPRTTELQARENVLASIQTTTVSASVGSNMEAECESPAMQTSAHSCVTPADADSSVLEVVCVDGSQQMSMPSVPLISVDGADGELASPRQPASTKGPSTISRARSIRRMQKRAAEPENVVTAFAVETLKVPTASTKARLAAQQRRQREAAAIPPVSLPSAAASVALEVSYDVTGGTSEHDTSLSTSLASLDASITSADLHELP
eukprot:TRINITY_DN3435_c0_g1_i2.p1 TRINITY_DN3435_c0_g1~~TRINITY_DN3435_c0_g1_i2.p1  ORF type:complete len:953 (-),score=185.99 TRINITY_DN3435_c0_g1_i2:1993-4851(-)